MKESDSRKTLYHQGEKKGQDPGERRVVQSSPAALL
jgi:hypothetical protein